MRTKNFLKHLILSALLLTTGKVVGQATVLGNSGIATNFLGWDNTGTNNFPLMVRHDLNEPIQFFTNNLLRMQLNPTQNSTINGFSVATDGFIGLGRQQAGVTAPSTPWTRLHLHDVQSGAGVVQLGFRPWMRNGLTLTGHGDQMYVGHRYGAAVQDPTDAIIQWSDNSGEQLGPDLLRFLFTGPYSSAATTGEASLDGREVMQLHPEGRVGVGDWQAATVLQGSLVGPTEHFDLLDGRMRIRDLPGASGQASGSYKVMVVDDAPLPSGERGVVKWVPASTFSGGADCKWTLLGAGNASIATAYAGNPGCPQYDRFVGIGTNAPSAKLHVRWTGPAGVGNAYGAASYLDGGTYSKTSGSFSTVGSGSIHIGVAAYASGALTEGWTEGNYAVRSTAVANAEGYTAFNRSVHAEANVMAQNEVLYNIAVNGLNNVQTGSTSTFNYGVAGTVLNYGTGAASYGGIFSNSSPNGVTTGYGIRAGSAGAGTNWAGWFDGDVQIAGDLWNGGTMIFSDENLKTNVEDVIGALGLVSQLQPKTYLYNTDAYPMMGLSAGPQIGLLAQEVGQVVPAAVGNTVFPAQYDSLGNETSAAFPLMGIDYAKIVPLLIGAIKEQQAAITELGERVNELQQQLAACCTNPDTGVRMAPGVGSSNPESALSPAQERLLRIAPNPFIDRTTLYCQLERTGRVQLIANSADGRDLRVLSEAQREAGAFQYEWSTEQLAPGVYYVTLLLDGEPLVKRAVKVGR